MIKQIIDKNKENLDIDTLNQYINDEGNNFSDLMESIVNIITLFNLNLLDNARTLFV